MREKDEVRQRCHHHDAAQLRFFLMRFSLLSLMLVFLYLMFHIILPCCFFALLLMP